MVEKKTYYKYLMFFTAAFISCFIVQGVLLNRLILIGHGSYVTGGTFIFFMSPLIIDIVAEVYGFRIARQLLWLGIFAIIFLTISTAIVVRLPSPKFWEKTDDAYFISMHTLVRSAVAGIIAVFLGQFINIYLISKLKIFTRGRYFWLRSVSSSLIGDTITVATSIILIFYGRIQIKDLSSLLIPELAIMVSFTALGAVPALILARVTAKAENIYVYDLGISFNLFSLSTGDNDREKNSKLAT